MHAETHEVLEHSAFLVILVIHELREPPQVPHVQLDKHLHGERRIKFLIGIRYGIFHHDEPEIEFSHVLEIRSVLLVLIEELHLQFIGLLDSRVDSIHILVAIVRPARFDAWKDILVDVLNKDYSIQCRRNDAPQRHWPFYQREIDILLPKQLSHR